MAFDRYQEDVLRKKWVLLHRRGEVAFESYEDFLAWCKETNWDTGMKLLRFNEDKPFSRDNCYWDCSRSVSYTYEQDNRAEKWERGVGPIREMLRPLIDAQLQKQKMGKQNEECKNCREVFRYEHPDLVREGIVFGADQFVR